MTLRGGRLAAACAIAAAASVVGPVPAGAQASGPVAAGWWWRLRPTADVPAPPSPAGEGLWVQGAPDGPVAVAALRAAVGPGERVTGLTLRVAPGYEAASDGAVIVACRATSPWEPESAGAWDRRPGTDCATGTTGVRAADGTAFTFDLTPLATAGGPLDVVLVPGRVAGPEGTNGSVFAVAFARPAPADLAVSPAPPGPAAVPDPTAPQGDAAVGDTEPGAVAAAEELARLPLPSGAPFDLGPAPFPTAPAATTPPTAGGPARTEQAVRARAGFTAGSAQDSSRPARAWALLVVVAATGVALWSARRPVPEPRALVRLANRPQRPEPGIPAATGGLGRFRRPRTRSPQPLV